MLVWTGAAARSAGRLPVDVSGKDAAADRQATGTEVYVYIIAVTGCYRCRAMNGIDVGDLRSLATRGIRWREAVGWALLEEDGSPGPRDQSMVSQLIARQSERDIVPANGNLSETDDLVNGRPKLAIRHRDRLRGGAWSFSKEPRRRLASPTA